jgi:hypothetical protein
LGRIWLDFGKTNSLCNILPTAESEILTPFLDPPVEVRNCVRAISTYNTSSTSSFQAAISSFSFTYKYCSSIDYCNLMATLIVLIANVKLYVMHDFIKNSLSQLQYKIYKCMHEINFLTMFQTIHAA